jgi:hypothetical protein
VQESKSCTQCKQVKPLSDYGKHKAMKSGIRSCCKLCQKKDAQRYAATDYGKQQILARKRVWKSKNADKISRHNNTYRLKNLDKIKEKNKSYREKNRAAILATQKRYRQANAEKVSANALKWQRQNKDKVNAKSKKWRTAHPEQASQIGKNFRQNNPENGKLSAARYRARKYKNGVFYVSELEVKSLLKKPCFYCFGVAEHLDHVLPIVRGGRHSIGNLVQSCASCNLSKGSKTVMEWRVWQIKMLIFYKDQ